MEKSTLILIILLIVFLLFASNIQYYTGQAVRTWFTQVDFCTDSDNGFYPFISGEVSYPYQGRTYKYFDTCNGNMMYEGTCKNNNLLKVPIKCPQGCAGLGADNHGACTCRLDKDCPSTYKCNNGACTKYVYTNR